MLLIKESLVVLKKLIYSSLLCLLCNGLIAQEYAATYRVTFIGEWSSQNHPIDFPNGAHFSPLVGHTHNQQGFIWQPGDLASPGIEVMAETGGVGTLNNEITALSNLGHSETYLIGSGIDADGMVSIEFDISLSHSLLSLVTMIAPSPDWFVGVHGIDLLNNQFWVADAMYELLPYDSGTDSGATFTSANQNTNPAEVITQINENPLPNNVPLGVLFFERLSITGTSPDVVFANAFEPLVSSAPDSF